MILKKNDDLKLLIVDDKSENAVLLLKMLESLEIEFFVALNGKDAIELTLSYDFDLILLDILMPDIDGYEVCRIIKNNPKTKDTNLIFISALSGVDDKIKGFSYGADDYITKPFVQKELLARVNLHLNKALHYQHLKKLLSRSFHELYNPLSIITTSIEMQNIKFPPSHYIDAISVATKSLQLVYNDLYYSISSRNKHEKILSIDLVEFLQMRIRYFYQLLKIKNLTIDFNNIEKISVQMREADLLRVVDNTISNAIKYSENSTTVTIRVINLIDSVVFECKNSGSTISNPEKIFDKGYRESFEQVGMGIGLEIVASICHTYDIDVEVTSQDGVTIFKYIIPKTLID